MPIKCGSWYYDSSCMLKLIDRCSEMDLVDFDCDPRKIDIKQSGAQFAHGLHRYYLKEDVPSRETGMH